VDRNVPVSDVQTMRAIVDRSGARQTFATLLLAIFAGVALVLGSWVAAAVLVAHLFWFDRRVREDEARLAERFGDAYRDYCRRVKRWIPGVL
jgi:protein-S-isoprenylcysteine O-methyltransferase Ste14